MTFTSSVDTPPKIITYVILVTLSQNFTELFFCLYPLPYPTVHFYHQKKLSKVFSISPVTLEPSATMPVRKDEDLLRTSGWLQTRSRTLCKLQRRYLVLGAQQLSCHRSETSNASWRLKIFNATIDTDAETNRITVQTQRRIVNLFAANESEYNHWLYFLQQAASRSIEKKYEFKEVIGSGAFGTVYRAHDLITRTDVAIKHIPKLRSAEDNRAVQEASLMRNLGNRRIVSTLGLYETIEAMYIVMEYIPGGNLHEVAYGMGAIAGLREGLVKGAISDILFGLVYLHDRGIVHRDLKLQNILCERNVLPCRVKIADFGLGGLVSNGLKSRVGSPQFVAPEIARGREYGVKVDCWSVGIIMYILLTGKQPFHGQTSNEVIRQVSIGRVAVGGPGWERVSESGIGLLKGLLERDSARRLGAREALQHEWFVDM